MTKYRSVYRIIVLPALVACLIFSPAWATPAAAATITNGPQNYSLASGFPNANATTLSFPRFDSALGTLSMVTLNFSGQFSGVSVNYDNELDVSGTATAFISDAINFGPLGGPVLNGSLSPSVNNQPLGSITADSDAAPDFVGADSAMFSGGSSLVSGSSIAPTPAQFIGGGNFLLQITAKLNPVGVTTPSFGGLETQLVAAGTTSGTVSMIYQFTPVVPEPATAFLMFGGLVPLLARRRGRSLLRAVGDDFFIVSQTAKSKKCPWIMKTRSMGLLQTRARSGAACVWGRVSLYRALLCMLLAFGAAASPAPAQVDFARLRTWGLETYNEIDRTLSVPTTRLFAETASLNGTQSGGFNGRAYVWLVSTQFRVLNTLAQIQPSTYTPILQQFADQVQGAYWDNGYRSGAGGGDRFYDDNGHLVVALTEAYRLTHNSDYLTRAKDTQSFVMEGEDAVAGGGIYFKQFDFSTKDAVSTLQGARGAAMLYGATGQQSYLNDATRLLTWARTHIQLPDGMFVGWDISTNSAYGFDLVNSAGIGISTNLELYDVTGSAAYLTEAQRMANRTLTRYFDSATGRINDEGF